MGSCGHLKMIINTRLQRLNQDPCNIVRTISSNVSSHSLGSLLLGTIDRIPADGVDVHASTWNFPLQRDILRIKNGLEAYHRSWSNQLIYFQWTATWYL